MLSRTLVLTAVACLSACNQIQVDYPDGGVNCPKVDASTTQPDMAVAPPKCAAAKGLPGDNILCVDFKDVQMPSSLTGWNFNCMQVTDSWTSSGGKLQVNNFSSFASTCSFTLPALSAADYQKYSSFTLSVVQTVDLNPTQQSASILLGADLPAQRIWTVTGKYAKMTTALQIAKPDLPNGGSGAYQPLFKITSAVGGGGYMGWQIESIAINGIP